MTASSFIVLGGGNFLHIIAKVFWTRCLGLSNAIWLRLLIQRVRHASVRSLSMILSSGAACMLQSLINHEVFDVLVYGLLDLKHLRFLNHLVNIKVLAKLVQVGDVVAHGEQLQVELIELQGEGWR